MALEDMVGPDKFLDAFNKDWPVGGEAPAEGDDHLRGVKNCLLNTFGALDRLYDLNLVSFWNEGANGAMYLPQGTTAQRPSAPVLGEWRFNWETGYLERWSGSAWQTPVAMTLQDNVYTVGSRQTFGRYVEAVRIGGGTGSPQPTYDAIRREIALVAGNILGGFRFLAPDNAATPNEVVYGDVVGRMVDPAEGATSGNIEHRAMVGGSLQVRTRTGDGLSVGSTLNPAGHGSVNAETYKRNDVQVSAYESTPQTLVKGLLYTFEHGLGGRAKLMRAYLQCAVASDGWAIGDEFELPVSVNRDHGSPSGGEQASFNTLYTDNDTEIKLQITAADRFTMPTKTGGFNTTPTLANYNVIVRASGW